MDLRDMPTTERNKLRQCFCGCDSFRFKINEVKWNDIDPDNQNLFYNICRNCNHSLGEHIVIVRSHQAE